MEWMQSWFSSPIGGLRAVVYALVLERKPLAFVECVVWLHSEIALDVRRGKTWLLQRLQRSKTDWHSR